MKVRKFMMRAAAGASLITACIAQDQPVSIQNSHLPGFVRPYVAPGIAPIHLTNSSRLDSLIRAGNLYLTVADALALAIENNLNLEIDRYGPLLADSALERAKAGGPLRGVPSGSGQISSVNSGVGVAGVTQAAGLSGGSGGGGGGGGTGAATIQQVGAVVPNFDPTLQNASNFSHLTSPQATTILAQTDALIQSQHVYNSLYSQGLLTGGQFQIREYQQHFQENAPDSINPVNSARMDLQFRQPLLQGFGVRLNDRTIRISQVNVAKAREQFRAQLLNLAASVLNLYWDLVAARDELKARQDALEITQKFYEDTRKEIAAEAIPAIQLPRAEAEVATRRQDVLIAQANVRQQEILLKEAVSHTEDPLLESAGVVPVDRIEVPDTDDLPPFRQLLATAMAKRPDVAVTKYTDQTNEMNLAGTANPLLPSATLSLLTYDRGLGGQGNVIDGGPPNPYFVGGYGKAFAQVFQRNFPNNQAGISFSMSFGNRASQGDYGIDQLQYRQGQVMGQRDTNAIVVEVSARMSALRQAHTRYSAARDTRILQEQLLRADQRKLASGGNRNTTFDTIMADQRALIAAQISEVNALANYARARISLDQVLGETLEKNNITLEEGLNGRVERQSQIPDIVGGQNAQHK
ncbi:MAG TPA: TolC family protein [Bryobacteraceae bacterium]|nr:TolC family protein [Bryobacteraceae bacterium]